MTNGEKYTTSKERAEAFRAWFKGRCDGEKCHGCQMNPCGDVIEKCFVWLDLPAPEEKPMPCQFCGDEMRPRRLALLRGLRQLREGGGGMKKLEELGIVKSPWHTTAGCDIVSAHGPMVAIGTCEAYDGGRYNARLIAAAPDLYECLREAVVEFCHECTKTNNDGDECAKWMGSCFVKKWRTALAKAAGEEEK